MFVYDVRKGSIFIFCMWISGFPNTVCWIDYPFSIVESWHPFWSFGHILHDSLFLGSLFHWSLCQYHIVLIIVLSQYVLKSKIYILKYGILYLPKGWFLKRIFGEIFFKESLFVKEIIPFSLTHVLYIWIFFQVY